MKQMLEPSCRVALAAMLHDIGKFAERARLDENTEYYRQDDCPNWNGRATHIHAAYTGVGFAALEPLLPKKDDLMDVPFGRPHSSRADDSLVNAAARHHRPDTALQWIIATADRLASGFERQTFSEYNQKGEANNHYQIRQLSLFEGLRLESKQAQQDEWVQPLKPLAPESLFPQRKNQATPANKALAQAEYLQLWQQFVAAVADIPLAHRQSLPMWLDHFDSAYQCFTHAIPSATAFNTRPDVSLYDHSKAVAALAVALWRWHEAQQEDEAKTVARLRLLWDGLRARTAEAEQELNTEKFLLVQGDFAGIQDFIFAEGSQTQKQAAKLLRGRSFQVSLLCELAALAVLEQLGLPSTSQIINAAGKFLIVAPNTEHTKQQLAEVQATLNEWFLAQTFGECGFSLAMLPAAQCDFTQKQFPTLIRRLFQQLEHAKLQRFSLCQAHAPAAIQAADFSQGPCAFDGRRPAKTDYRGQAASLLACDQIEIGRYLANPLFDRLLVVRTGANVWQSSKVKPLSLDYFGFQVAFARDEDDAGRFGDLARRGQLLRCWDFHFPLSSDGSKPVFVGYARRDINGYVPLFDPKALEWESAKYGQWEAEAIELFDREAPLKTFNHLACEDKIPCTADLEQWQGITALTVLKGDVDNLGMVFQRGIDPVTFARMAALSRQLNSFFALYLPWLCAKSFPNTYTVFAGGDDFFLIGPWAETQALAGTLAEHFAKFVAGNPELHFSAGMVMVKPGIPVRALAETAEDALEQAKKIDGKNAVTCHQVSVSWSSLASMKQLEQSLETFRADYRMSTGFVYRLLTLSQMAEGTKPEDSIWQSWLAYRVRRFVVDQLPSHLDRQQAQADIAGKLRAALLDHKLAVQIAVSNHLYRYRT